MRRLLLAALILTVAGPAAAQEKIEPPRVEIKPGDPLVMPPMWGQFGAFQPRTVKVDGDDLVSEQQVTRFVQKVVEKTVKIGDKEETVKAVELVPVTEMVKSKTALKDVKAFSADGKPVAADDLKKRLAKPTVVLASPLPGPPPAEWKQLLRDDALVVFLPPQGPAFPLPPDPKPPQPEKPLPPRP